MVFCRDMSGNQIKRIPEKLFEGLSNLFNLYDYCFYNCCLILIYEETCLITKFKIFLIPFLSL
jgi:hypothetical protein